MRSRLLRGLLAGAAGITALNAATYLDMVLRGRPASTTPEDTVRRTEDLLHLPLSDEGPDSPAAANRRSGLGALMGIEVGLGTGVLYSLIRPRLCTAPVVIGGLIAGLVANVGSVAPMTALGVTDPRNWSAASWISDIVPHLCYGLVTAAAYEEMSRSTPPRRWVPVARLVRRAGAQDGQVFRYGRFRRSRTSRVSSML